MSYTNDPGLQANQLPISVDFPTETPDFKTMVQLLYKRTANAVNTKKGSLYDLREVSSFDQYFTPSIPNSYRPGYRTTFDLVTLNGGSIPVGVTNIAVNSTTTPPNIVGPLVPINGYGTATGTGPTYYFTGMNLEVKFNNTVPTAQVITVTNNTGSTLTQMYWVFEYLKT